MMQPGECSEVKDNETECDPLVVVAPPGKKDPPPPDDPCFLNPYTRQCGWPGDPGDPGDPGRGGGGGDPGGDPKAPPGEEEGIDVCDALDPQCPKPLSDKQAEAVANALARVRKNIRDPEVQRICTSLQRTAKMMLEDRKIMAGNKDIPDSPDGEDHTGQYNGATDQIHIDEDFLDRAIAENKMQSLGAIILHETAHKEGHSHVGDAPPYTSFPFRHTSFTGYSRPGIEECM